ncbi:MAG: PASTA domain-containing protein [Coriobacteriia bacterium]|nr:PASTA domain-containing protein [Coriobacteriia bacterium]
MNMRLPWKRRPQDAASSEQQSGPVPADSAAPVPDGGAASLDVAPAVSAPATPVPIGAPIGGGPLPADPADAPLTGAIGERPPAPTPTIGAIPSVETSAFFASAPAPAPAPKRTPAQAMAAAAAASEMLSSRAPETSPAAQTPTTPPATPSPDASGAMPGAPAPAPVPAPATPAIKRRGLIPRWLPWAAGITALVVLLTVLGAVFLSRSSIVRVPSLQGLEQKAARTRLQELGLTLVVGDERFSASSPVGTIIDQQPAPGTQVKDGTVVRVAVSAGSESFAMPDMVGQSLDAARKKLRDRGLSVEFQTVPSDKDQGTVVSSVPSPGVTVQTGDTVRLTIAAGTSGSDTLLPSDLKGKTIVLDPMPMPAGTAADTTMDIARRVRALLEASGARVVMTRSVVDTGDAANTLARSRRAKETSSSALVGFSVTQSGATGIAVMSVPNTSTTQTTYMKSLALTQALTDTLKSSFAGLTSATAANDTILTDTGVPAVRIRLGMIGSSADKLSFTDPEWADNVAKATYRAIAQVYGGK